MKWIHLFISSKALGLSPSLEACGLAYVATVLLMIVSPFLRGLGAVELSMVFILHLFGFSTPNALATTILYRLFEFWLPLLAGLFSFAWKGLHYAFSTQINFKVHTYSAIVAILLGIILKINGQDWLWISLAIGLVLIVELINTAIEVLVDFISPGYHPKAGIIKDVSAAAVLLTAFLSVLIGLMVFVPKIF